MEIKISMSTRDGKAYAEGIYTENNVVVKAGGRVSAVFKGSDAIRQIRQDPSVVDSDGNILVDCTFNSPSTAAQFVNGNISNGLRVWKVDGQDLKKYLAENELK